MRKSELEERWNGLDVVRSNIQRLDATHPLDIFVGITEIGQREIILYSNEEPQIPKSSSELKVEKCERKDGRWATVFTSLNKDNDDLFLQLCLDLVESSRVCRDECSGIRIIIARFISWQRLFQSKNECLSKETLKGIIGEILFAIKAEQHGISWDNVVNSWEGPEGADRDFGFCDYWVEAKAISVSKDTISISSLNQLDTDVKGYLYVQRVESVKKDTPDSISFYDFIESIRNKLADYPVTKQVFEGKLLALGYVDRSEYKEEYFCIGSSACYEVRKCFPKLTPNNVDSAITKAEYAISLPAIEKYRVDEEEIWN